MSAWWEFIVGLGFVVAMFGCVRECAKSNEIVRQRYEKCDRACFPHPVRDRYPLGCDCDESKTLTPMEAK